MQVATRLAPIELLESGSQQNLALGSYWRDQAAVLIFLRHFG